MPRIGRAVAPGCPHHVTQRGNYQQDVFETEEDYENYLAWLRAYSKRYGLQILAYCLMPNHVHFIAIPSKLDSLARTFNVLHMKYAQYLNRKRKTTGHLWQGRFFSCPLDQQHLYAALRYVENNPVKAGLAQKPHDYRWSSAYSHTYNDDKRQILANDCSLIKDIRNWPTFLRQSDDAEALADIRQQTKTGRPCGSEAFVDSLEQLKGKRLRAGPRGRPRIIQK